MHKRTTSSLILIELCAGGIGDVELAAQLGLHRIELNCGVALGGLTPTASLMQEARAIFPRPIIAMIRPREGGFCYSESEFRLMLLDCRYLMDLGADGIATGVLNTSGALDEKRCEMIRETVPEATLVFHRAFDVVPDPTATMEKLVSLGWNRILTSGESRTVIEGAARLRQLQISVGDRIEILPGAGIRAENVCSVLQETGLRQIHTSAGSWSNDLSMSNNGLLNFSVPGAANGGDYFSTNADSLQKLMLAVRSFSAAQDHADGK